MNQLIAQIEQARNFQASGQNSKAEKIYRTLIERNHEAEFVLRSTTEFYLHTKQLELAIECLVSLTKLKPDEFSYYNNLANLYVGNNQKSKAINTLRAFLKRQRESVSANFNLAILLKRTGDYQGAINSYQQALEFSYSDSEQIYSNLGVIYSELLQPERAKYLFLKALKVKPDYIPAKYNLAGLYEELGQKKQAIDLYQAIINDEPDYFEALIRICFLQTNTAQNEQLRVALTKALVKNKQDSFASESLAYALGKLYDDRKQFDEAYKQYSNANYLNSKRIKKYDRKSEEKLIDKVIDITAGQTTVKSNSELPKKPLFICGMFRSGSTLIEQMLAAHPDIFAAGELNYFSEVLYCQKTNFPESLQLLSSDEKEGVKESYLKLIKKISGREGIVIDKRPDNFFYLGLIKQLFPEAKIIHTQRKKRDNYLSIYFQQLNDEFSYSTSIENIEHYHNQHSRLMEHWEHLFGEDIFNLDYETLIESPDKVLRELYSFCGISDHRQSKTHSMENTQVKTASLWQVREPLHNKSIDRWENYRQYFSCSE